MKLAITYAAGGGLWWKRDLDRQGPLANIGRTLMTPVVVEQESPPAVETRPFGALKLWTRVRKLQNEFPQRWDFAPTPNSLTEHAALL